MNKIIITSYTKQADGSLVLRNNFLENFSTKEEAIFVLLSRGFNSCDFPSWLVDESSLPKNKLSYILESQEQSSNIVYHCRILTF